MTITEILDDIKNQLTNDPLVSAAVSAVISPEGKSLLSSLISGLADLEAKHAAAAEADKTAAVEAAKTAQEPAAS